jgi:glycopeptide antibiotics resistance protein
LKFKLGTENSNSKAETRNTARETLTAITKNKLFATAFTVYIGVVAAITIVPTHVSRLTTPHSDHINLVPFGYSFKCFNWTLDARSNLRAFCLINLLGNVALFVPLGILLPLVGDRFRSLKRVLLVALGLSLSIEAIQFLSRFLGIPRAVDIDDVILNTLGGCLGFALFKILAAGARAAGKSKTKSESDASPPTKT